MDGERNGGVMWGLRSPTPCGRTESCTLHILRMCSQVLTEKDCRTGWLCHCSGFRVQRSERALRAGLHVDFETTKYAKHSKKAPAVQDGGI